MPGDAIKKFTLKCFKSFKDEQSFFFAVPDNGKVGSGLTYVVGPNNSGKTTLLEALMIRGGYTMKTGDKTGDGDPKFSIYREDGLSEGNLLAECSLIRSTSNTLEEKPELPSAMKFELISSRRRWESSARDQFHEIGASIQHAYNFKSEKVYVSVGSELRIIESDTDKYKSFVDFVKRVVPEFCSFAVGNDDSIGEYIEYRSASGSIHKTDLLGDGVISIIRIMLHLFVNNTTHPLIIDEPELSLHPEAQKRLVRILAEFSQRRQIVIATHSPYFISWEYLLNGAVVNRVVKEDDEYSTVFSITDFGSYRSFINGENWRQPFLLDEVAKEIFFMRDKILFLEGQEDVGLLKGENILDNVNIFGYGVRGKDNFKLALRLAKNLGYKQACCILDNGQEEELLEKSLKSEFEPGYKIIKWNRSDIRDKDAFSETAKKGYFDSQGRIKTEDDLDDFRVKIASVRSYFSA